MCFEMALAIGAALTEGLNVVECVRPTRRERYDVIANHRRPSASATLRFLGKEFSSQALQARPAKSLVIVTPTNRAGPTVPGTATDAAWEERGTA